MITEFDVYSMLVDFLKKESWQIVCASPPGGTNSRYRKCLLPRRDLHGSKKGPRDEVDLVSHNSKAILLIECKPRLSHSLHLTTRLFESDYTKLKRITESFPPSKMIELLRRLSGLMIPPNLQIIPALAVAMVNCKIPSDMTVLELKPFKQKVKVFGVFGRQFF